MIAITITCIYWELIMSQAQYCTLCVCVLDCHPHSRIRQILLLFPSYRQGLYIAHSYILRKPDLDPVAHLRTCALNL